MATSDFENNSGDSGGFFGNNGRYMSGGGEWKPKNLIDAISEIQQFFVMEKEGQSISPEFLTLEGTIGFFKTGMKTGFNEAIFIFLLFPIFWFYLTPFTFHSGWLGDALLDGIPFVLLIVNTIMCLYMGRYHIGTLTRRAIHSVYFGRTIILVIMSFVLYVLYFCAANLAKPVRVWSLVTGFTYNEEMAKSMYYGAEKVLPYVIPSAMVCSLLMLMGGLLPYGAVFLLDRKRRKKKDKTQARVDGD